MQNMRKRLLFSTLAGLTLCVTMTARMTSAQGPGGQGQRGQGQGGQNGNGGGQGGGQGNQRQNFQGQGGRGGGQMPFAMGTITSGDANARTITIQSQFGGNAQTIQLGTATQLVTQTSVTVADLKVNDQVQVQGMPTGITASSLTVGQMPTFLQGGGRGGPGGGQGGNGGQNGAQNANGTAQGLTARTASASATGRVVSLNPLTLAINNDVTITIKMASNARVTKITPLAFSGLKVGDRVMASGQAATDGSFTATGVAINMTMGRAGLGAASVPADQAVVRVAEDRVVQVADRAAIRLPMAEDPVARRLVSKRTGPHPLTPSPKNRRRGTKQALILSRT